ncbi:MAG: TATA-box-binding protein [Candidatus Heimdallarchaeaceae archaeon]
MAPKIDYGIVIQNVVASINLFTTIDLVTAYQTLIDDDDLFVSYNPETFPGLILKIKKPKISSLVFSSGKLVLTGAKSTNMVHEGVQQMIKILRSVGTKITEEPEIIVQNIVASGQNIVASGHFNHRTINLELAALWLEHSMYEPEQFPGLIYRLAEPKTVLLLFQSGNLVCTGAKTEEQVRQAVENTYNTLDEINAFDF